MDTRIYIATHKKFDFAPMDGYIPLHVGRAGKEDLGYLGDDTGDNISEKNANFCELTGMYWMWKNVTCDIIGLCHYRRFFTRNYLMLTRQDIETLMETYDMIEGSSSMTPEGSIGQQYRQKHFAKDLETTRTVTGELYPEYLPAFDWALSTNMISFGNMIVMRKGDFDAYCEWLFRILFEVERRTDLSGYDTYQSRIYGFLSERLLRVWLMRQSFRVREEQILQSQ